MWEYPPRGKFNLIKFIKKEEREKQVEEEAYEVEKDDINKNLFV